MSSNQVIAHGFSEDSSTIAQLFVQGAAPANRIKSEAVEILENTRGSLMSNFQRKNVEGTLGRWALLKKSKCVYFLLAKSSYPERLSYQLLNVK